MAVETYTVQYIADPSAFVAGARQVEAAVRAVDAATTASKKNLAGFAGGGARSATNAAKKINDLAAALGGVAPAAAAATASMQGLTVNSARASASTGGLGGILDGSIAKFLALGVAIKAAGAALEIYSKAAEDAKKHLNQGAQGGLDKRDQAREYANLLGKPTVDDDTMKRLFGLAQAGGMDFDEALKFGEQFEGSLPAGKQKGHIADGQKQSLMEEAAAFGSRIGLDAATAGDLAGVIPQYVDLTKDDKGKPLTDQQGVDKGLGQLGALAYGLNEGRGKISTLARSEIGAAASALASGHVSDHAEMGAFAGVASTFTKSASGSGTGFKQMDRLVNEGLGDEGEWLKSIGVADQKGDLAKLKVLKAHIDAQRAAAADPSKFDAKGYLQSKGFRENGELDSTLAFLENVDVLEKRTVEARKRAGDGQSVRASNREFLASQTGQDRQGRAMQEAGNYEQTRRRQRLAAARKAAYGQLQAEGKIDTFGTNLTDGFMDGTINKLKPNTEHEARIDQRVWENARDAAHRAGIEGDVLKADARFINLTPDQAKARGLAVQQHGGMAVKGYDGQDPAKLDDFLNTFGPSIEGKSVSINGRAVDVGVNPAEAARQAAAKGAAPGGNVGGPRAAADGSSLGRTAEKLDKAAEALMVAARMSRGTPGSNLGGDYGPYRA